MISRDDIATKKQGEFTYTIQEENLARVPVFLFYGIDPNYPEEFTPITGKMVDLTRKYEVGENVIMKWKMDSNGVIVITSEGLDEDITVDQGGKREFLEKKKVVDSLIIN